jgi:hypothetical protein
MKLKGQLRVESKWGKRAGQKEIDNSKNVFIFKRFKNLLV